MVAPAHQPAAAPAPRVTGPAISLSQLQPSAMPPPAPSPHAHSPRRQRERTRQLENPIRVPARFDKSTPGQGLGLPGVPDKDDVFFQRPSLPREREALGRLDTPNTSTSAATTTVSLKRTGLPPPPSFHTSIPRAPVEPDVFSSAHAGAGSKRAAAAETDRSSKRRVLEDPRIQDQRLARETEQEKWKFKWLKMFPTLTFHFEMEAQEGPGRLLKARTTKMGAVSPPSYSRARETHRR